MTFLMCSPPACHRPSQKTGALHGGGLQRRCVACASVACLTTLIASTACAPVSQAPTAEDAAAYLGLSPGRELMYELNDGTSETHVVQASSVIVPDALVFDVVARSGSGFGVPDRTLSIAVRAEAAQLVRFSDCIVSCREPSSPIGFLDLPLEAGASLATEADVVVTDNRGTATTVRERHVFVVGDTSELEVPAGTFSAHPVSWTRVRDDRNESAVLHLVPDEGIVGWEGFDGTTLRLAR